MSGIMDALFGTLEVVTGSTFLPGDDPKESSTDEYGAKLTRITLVKNGIAGTIPPIPTRDLRGGKPSA